MRLRPRAALLLAAVLSVPALPGLAGTGPVAVTPRVVSQALAAGETVLRLTGERGVGVTWTAGAPRVAVRWHTAAGWSPWRTAEDDTGDADAREHGLPGTDPQWRPTGADLVGLRVTGPSRHLRLLTVSDGAVRRSPTGAVAEAASGAAFLGGVHSRADWGADESVRRGTPEYADRVDAVVVHHTAQGNDYSPADVPRLIRADYAFHVQGRGWNDLGYNLVVDRFGGIWEGRAGGLGRATVGAHAQGFNTRTLGVSLIGDMTQGTAPAAAQRALARVVAYAAATWHFDPTGSAVLTSGGSPRYAAGRRVVLHRVFGHLETGQTSCPGSLQGRLPDLRAMAAAAFGPAARVVSVVVRGAPVHAPAVATLDARLNRAADWTVDVRDQGGAVVASSRGTSAAPHLAWNGLSAGPQLQAGPETPGAPALVPALPGTYRWTVTADDGFHPVAVRRGDLEVGPPLV